MIESVEPFICTAIVGAVYLIVLGILNLKKPKSE